MAQTLKACGTGCGAFSQRLLERVDRCILARQGVLDTGRKLSDDNTIGKEEIQQRLAQFLEHWQELKQLAAAR